MRSVKYLYFLVGYITLITVFAGVLKTQRIFDSQRPSSEKKTVSVLSDSTLATPTTFQTCSEPTSGCGTGHYWDSATCSCRSSSSGSTCVSPSSGCPSGSNWSSTYCSCIASSSPTGCVSPTSGCDSGKYWDSSTCSCKSTTSGSTCQEPSGGCGTYYYWDIVSCVCKPKTISSPTVTPFQTLNACVSPAVGCGSDKYWELATCSCRSSGENQALQSGTLTPAQTLETETIPNTVLTCVVNGIGESAYQAIISGTREPTFEEHLIYESCSGTQEVSEAKYYSTEEKVSPETTNCLKSALGTELYNKIYSGKAEVPDNLRDNVDSCFGINKKSFKVGKTYRAPEEYKACVADSLGNERFGLLRTGKDKATSEEINKVEDCSKKLNKIQVKFMPPPVEQVPFLEPEKETISVKAALQEDLEIKKLKTGGKVIFSGKGPSNSVVYIYIFSEPIVVTTKTDNNGDWIYELNEPLKGEKHIAYATVKNTSGKTVRSDIFDFQVKAATQEQVQNLRPETQTLEPQKNYIRYVILIIGAGLVVLIAMVSYMDFKKQTEEIKAEESQAKTISGGDGKNKT